MTTASPQRSARRRKSAKAVIPALDSRVTLAMCLDRNADLLLVQGCHLAAERLACRAQALREATP